MRATTSLMVLMLAGSALAPIAAQAAKRQTQAGAPATSAALPFADVQYRLVGPFRGGRVGGVAGVAQDVNTYYFGASAGGVWKTTDAGRTWKPLWDNFPEASPSIGAIAVAPSDPNIVYVGTGEANIRGDVVTGNGVYKSTDAGKTWHFSGLKDSQAIGRMIVHPGDPNTVYVAALGHVFGDNSERGIFRSRDGGKSWQRVLYVDDKTGGIDVQFDPSDPKVLYAGMWQVFRKPWTFESGGPGSGFYKSTDGGDHWRKLSGHGLPDGIYGRIGVAPTTDPKRVYAMIEAEKGGLYRTDDGGEHWALINDDNAYKQRAWYYTNVFADPKDPAKVFVMNTNAYRSTDAGKTFKKMPTFHGDDHSLWVNPSDPRYMINGNDGGAGVSVNGGDTWTEQMNQPTAQFYHISVDNRVPYHLYGAQQDNSTVEIASANVRGPIGVESFRSVGGGESGYVVPDPTNPNIVIANGYSGDVTRFDGTTGMQSGIGPWAHEIMGWAPKDLLHRPQWTEPLVFSPHDPNTLYNADEVLFRSTDQGKSWKIISPDLTRNDKTKQQAAGGPLTKDNTGVEIYDTIFSVAESPVRKDLIWAGTDDGLIQLTRDGGANWSNVTPKAMPEWGTVDMVEVDPHRAGTAYIAVDRHRLDDLKPYAFRTDDFGKTWTSITAGIPDDAYMHVVRADPERAGLLYAGTDNGIFVSYDDGARWRPLQLNLPRTPVHDLKVHAGDLAVATHGRAFWVLDDLTPVRDWSDDVARQAVHLFAPRTALRIRYGRGNNAGTATGANPPSGAIVYYYLKDGGTKEKPVAIKLEILDSSDKVIRTFPPAHPAAAEGTDGAKAPGDKPVMDKTAATKAATDKVSAKTAGEAEEEDEDSPSPRVPRLGTKAGVNRFVWDMRYEGPVAVPKSALWRATLGGPMAVPGRYKVRLTVNGKTQTQPFEIAANPNLKVTQADLQKQFDLNVAINEQLSAVQKAVLEMRALHARLTEVRGKAPALSPAADALERKFVAIEDRLIQRKAIADEDPLNYPIRLNNMLASLGSIVGNGDAAPTAQAYTEWDELHAQARQGLADWAAFKSRDLASFNAATASQKLAPIQLGRSSGM